jgi:predicted ester cyclase
MGAEENKALYQRWLTELWGTGNYEVADEIIAADLVDHSRLPGQPAGPAGDVWAAQQVRGAFPDLRFDIDVLFADEEYVTGRWTMTGTNSGELQMLGIPPTGRPVKMSGQEIFRVSDGRFTEVWHLEDLPGMLTQLKLGPPPSFVMRMSAKRSAWQFRREQTKR